MQLPASKDTRFSRVDRYIQQEYIDTGRLAGAQIAIQHRAAIRRRCLGFLGRERTRPLANTFFWCDPVEQLIGIFMTQILSSDVYPLQVEIRERPITLFVKTIGGASMRARID